jgi:predicted ribosome-associated RNA-binding protein Tma20
VKALKELWVDKGQEHHLLEGLDVMLQAPYLIKAD